MSFNGQSNIVIKESKMTNDDGANALAKLRAEIEASVCHNRCGDADDLARAIDALIIHRVQQGINAMGKAIEICN